MWRQAVVQKQICNYNKLYSLKFYNLRYKVATVKPLLQHLWRRKECGWTTLPYSEAYFQHFCTRIFLKLQKNSNISILLN
jgi:hypothetical protein